MTSILKMFRREHADLARLLHLLDRQLSIFREGGQPDYELILNIIEYCLDYPDSVHHPREDLVFRKLLERDWRTAEMVSNMESGHIDLARQTRELAAAVRQVIAEETVDRKWVWSLGENLLQAYNKHIAFEEDRFFPLTESILTESDWAEIEARLDNRDDPLFGEQVASRFQALREEIDGLARITRKA